MTQLYVIVWLAIATLALAAVTLVAATIYYACVFVRWIASELRARRNERQVRAHMLARKGFKECARRGWVRETNK